MKIQTSQLPTLPKNYSDVNQQFNENYEDINQTLSYFLTKDELENYEKNQSCSTS